MVSVSLPAKQAMEVQTEMVWVDEVVLQVVMEVIDPQGNLGSIVFKLHL